MWQRVKFALTAVSLLWACGLGLIWVVGGDAPLPLRLTCATLTVFLCLLFESSTDNEQ